MNQHKIRGIIIRKTNYSDNDIIFDVLSDKGEIIGFFARGARKLKSKYSGMLQIGMVLNIAYTKGKNLNYPDELTIDPKFLFSFYSRSLQHMNLYTDVISILKNISKDLEDPELFSITVECFRKVENGEDLLESYNKFLSQVLEIITVESNLLCAVSGDIISEKEFYYIPESNKTISKNNRPNSIDNMIRTEYSHIFYKEYLQKLILEHVHHKLRLKF